MALGLGLGITKAIQTLVSSVGSFIWGTATDKNWGQTTIDLWGDTTPAILANSIATTHYNRVIADGGVLPAGIVGLSSVLDSVITAYGVTDSTDFNTKVPVFLDPHYTGYKLGAGSGTTLGQAAQKVYSVYAGIPQVSDPDAQSFIYRVYTAGGELTTTEANATNQLVLDMKAAGIWTSMKAIYPMVGASAAACAQNLVSSSYTLTFYGSITYSSTGIKGNGVNGYADTGYSRSGADQNNFGLSYYTRDLPSTNTGGGEIGTNGVSIDWMLLRSAIYFTVNSGSYSSSTNANWVRGFYSTSRLLSNSANMYYNGSNIITDTSTSVPPDSLSAYLLALNLAGTAGFYSVLECAFAAIKSGLNATQESNFYTSVQIFQTTLSRQV
jgi:hypothetical protein